MKKNYGNNLLILLDEPGLTLHGRAQADLLRYFNEKLRPKHQLIYTTHSPFMIDPEHLLSVRTVEDRSQGSTVLGTKVEGQSLTVERDTVLPILGALGIDITQTLFVGRHTILVEGPSDLLYMKWFSHRLRSSGRVGLDPRWTISPVGGLKKIASFVTLFSTQPLNIAVFTDYHSGDKSEIERLKAGDLLKKGQVLSAEVYTNERESDIEDLIGAAFYAHLINKTYSLAGNQALSVTPQPGVRVVASVEEHFRLLPPPVPEFRHYDPAAFLVENNNEFANAPGLCDALDRFERVFQDFNAMLPKAGSVARKTKGRGFESASNEPAPRKRYEQVAHPTRVVGWEPLTKSLLAAIGRISVKPPNHRISPQPTHSIPKIILPTMSQLPLSN